MPSLDVPGGVLAEILVNVRVMREYATLGRYQPALIFAQGLIEQCSEQMKVEPTQREVLQVLKDDLTKEHDLIQGIVDALKGFSGLQRGDDPPDASPGNRWDDRPVRAPDYVGIPSGMVQPPAHPGVGERNEAFFGDKDRFGPGYDPAAAPMRPRWRGGGGGRGEEDPRPVRRVASGGLPKKMPADRPEKERRKELLPRAARARSPRAGAREHKDDDGDARPKYQPRRGEEDMAEAITNEIVDVKKGVGWEAIAGNDEAKKLLEEAVILPILLPDFFRGIRRPWRGVLMYGPPGTGKTLLAKAVATECGTTFFNVSSATLTSKWRGDSEKLVRLLFEIARHHAPSTIFIDEIDALGAKRSEGNHEASNRMMTELLTQMDGITTVSDDNEERIVMVLGATNHPWVIDQALRRRLEKRIYIPCPTLEDRVALFKINTQKIETTCTEEDWIGLARKTENYSGADITMVCRDASLSNMRRLVGNKDRSEIRRNAKDIQQEMKAQPVSMDDFERAIRNTPPSVTQADIRKFEEWGEEFCAGGVS